MSTDDKRRNGKTIVPSHQPMPGIDDDIIDAGASDRGQLPPADAPERSEIAWDGREHDVEHLPDAADLISRPGAEKGAGKG